MLHISFLAMAYLQTPLLGYDVKCNQALMPSWSQPRLKNSGSIFNANLIGCYEKKKSNQKSNHWFILLPHR